MAINEAKEIYIRWNNGPQHYKRMSDSTEVKISRREYDDLFIKFSNQAISNYINKFGQ